jgi:hypothetical protein
MQQIHEKHKPENYFTQRTYETDESETFPRSRNRTYRNPQHTTVDTVGMFSMKCILQLWTC